MCLTFPSILSYPDPLLPVEMWCWSSLCLISAWHPTASLPTTPVSPVVLRYQQVMWEPSQGATHQYVRLNPLNADNLLPPPHSHPDPQSNLSPLRDPDLSNHREAEDGKTQGRTGGCQSADPMEMERGLVGGANRACSDWKIQDLDLKSCLFFASQLFFSLVPQNPLCAKACKRDGTIKSSFCASEFGKFPHKDQPAATWPGFTLSAFRISGLSILQLQVPSVSPTNQLLVSFV